MNKYVYLNITNWLKLIAAVFSLSVAVAGAGRADILPDNFQIHGFLTQGLFHSSENNVFGQSAGGISPGLTEIGFNASYKPLDRLRFAVQGLYRRAGDIDRGSVKLDYGLVDWTVINYDAGRLGIRAGRVKIPFGLYNETRDVAFTHPTILLPQGIYFDRSRSLLVSADGGSFYADHRTAYGDFSFKFNYALPLGNNKEIRSTILGPAAMGEFDAEPAIATQLNYEINGGEYIFALSYMDLNLDYRPLAFDPFSAGKTHIRPLMFSAQYNGEKFTLTGEYDYRWNRVQDFGTRYPDSNFVTESWYLQGSYQLFQPLQATLRYDVIYMDKDDKNGSRAAASGLPSHIAYANDWMLGLRWDITPSWMLRAEYHRVHGTAWLSQADNPDRKLTVQDWNLYGLQLSFRF